MKKNKEINNKEIGQRIRTEREKLGLSREEFAEIIELSDYYVGQLERGERQMSLPVLAKVANCLHVSLDFLVFGKTAYNNYYIHDVGNAYNYVSDIEINELLNKCSPKELELVKKLIKTVLPYVHPS
ncbi:MULTISPECIES: helix-turn-helix domain-containing protein [Carboxydocella]|uniref:Helix-turn-helix n=2 Tax=Carboxydocella TaxID=178898 RepID=A0A1T4S967_9FIRM|nr:MULTISPECIES: helix-turn-helix transcriptional regulator [Carboxydocella]AVX19643.1 helix-turn-helix protein [Carboxydocella thermautotrophica]AVX30050.1 helix-turn-helix protein [Carboxydocella thermautotrophica]SKA24448.1 Helix-turn-helix [Carboxydocella sporoproducens DSM 16521]GAW29508.1 transcriptional regulator [Carboxydocella sp. ULO1]GAW31294.1 transcriptional regulator [Carboxydocella sp. JDF658]